MQPMSRSWEEIQEDASGGLSATNSLSVQMERKRGLQAAADASGGGGGAAGQGGVIEKGVIRYLFVILDFSWHSGQNDLKVQQRSGGGRAAHERCPQRNLPAKQTQRVAADLT